MGDVIEMSLGISTGMFEAHHINAKVRSSRKVRRSGTLGYGGPALEGTELVMRRGCYMGTI